MVVAKDFEAYKAARETARTKGRPALVEAEEENAPAAEPAASEPDVQPLGGLPSLLGAVHPATRTSTSQTRTATPAGPLPPDAVRPGDDACLRIKCGDYARAEAAILRLRAEGLPVTQANLNHELGYASTPSCCGSSSGCQGASQNAAGPKASCPAAASTRTGSSLARTVATKPVPVANVEVPAPRSENPVITVAPPPPRQPSPVFVQPASHGAVLLNRPVRKN